MKSESALPDEALDVLRSKWPRGWGDPRLQVRSAGDARADALLQLTLPDFDEPVRIAIEVKASLTPRDTASVADQLRQSMQIVHADAGLIVSRWLSPKTREAIAESGLSYIDLTGNLSLVLRRPPLAISAEGADTDPDPQSPSVRGLSGPKGGVIARTLADVFPPYTVTDLAEATGLSASFTSRVLSGLEEEGIIDRVSRGPVLEVDVRRLIERWTKDYELLESNECSTYVFPDGPRAFERLLAERVPEPWALTGSLGAARLAPVAAPSLAIAYVDRPAEIAKQLGLLPAESGANAILASPFNPVVYERCWKDDGAWLAAPSQLAADCLTGPGRMPNEGDALLRWMQENEDRWRAPSLDEPPPTPPG